MAADVEKLRKELDRKVKSYEGKLATLTAINSALQTENDKLRKAAGARAASAAEQEVEELKEEFARRLGAADRQIAQLQDEKDWLRQQLQLASEGGSASEARLQEKEQHIKSLQLEGEKLSRKNGELEATSRKLRAQLRDTEAERDRLASRLAAAEAQQAEQAQRANNAELALAEQAAAHEAQLDEVRRSAQARVSEREAAAAEQASRSQEQAAREAAEALSASIEREAVLSHNIAELRTTLEEREEREADLRQELASLEGRVRELEAVNHALQSNTTDATRPLLRQIESLAAAASVQQAAARETEQRLSQRVRECEEALAGMTEARRAAVARAEAAEGAAQAAHDAAHSAAAAAAEVKAQCEAEQARCTALQQQVARLEDQLRAAAEASGQLLEGKDSELQSLQERLWEAEERLRAIAAEQRAQEQQQPPAAAVAAGAGVAEPRVNGSTAQQQQQQQRQQQQQSGGEGRWRLGASTAASRGSRLADEGGDEEPPSELDGGGSVADTGGTSGEDEMDEMLRTMSQHGSGAALARTLSPRYSAGDLGGSRAALLEAQLALLERARDAANDALAQALGRAAQLEADAWRCHALKAQLDHLSSKHSLLLEVLGERNERVEQLEEDVRDMKRIFHEQLQEAVDQLAEARRKLQQADLDVQ